MTVYLEIAVNVPHRSGVFHYHLPPELEGKVQVGNLVVLPFGSQTVQGVVVDFIEQPEVPQTRPVIGLVDPNIALTIQQIKLARQISHDCLAPLAACIGLMLPPGIEKQSESIYTIHGVALADLSKTQMRLVNLLEKRGPLRGNQIDRAMPRVDWRASAKSLIRRGIISTQTFLPEPRIRPKTSRTARLACPLEDAESRISKLGRPGSDAQMRRQRILRFLIQNPGPVDTVWLYAESGGNSADLHYLSDRGLIAFDEAQVIRDPLTGVTFTPYQQPVLTSDQSLVWDEVKSSLARAHAGQPVRPILLHGVTGSGKTEIYLHAVGETLKMGAQAIVLVPEIALTPQTLQRFAGRFPGQVGLIHSGLSDGERYDTWRRAHSGEFGLVVGPRSALFMPLSRLKLIVIDEFHDSSYYQGEIAPCYHAREAAITYAQMLGAVCLLGSATPDVESMYASQSKQWQYLRLPTRILAHRQVVQAQMKNIREVHSQSSRYQPFEADAETIDLPPVSLVDMRQELKEGNRSIFSRLLQDELRQVLEHQEQAILFLNRRGTATYVFCRDCGHTLKCPRCDIPLTYHEAGASLICHYCGYKRNMVSKCPICSSEKIRQFGTGTQRVEAEVRSLFPTARILRWDHETTRLKGAHAAILDQFVSHKVDVLVGTQMLAKGLDLPLVTLVGVVLADVGLSLPDYRAGERTFQILTQVAGRAGRSPLGGQVIMQTFQPEHYAIRAAAKHDFYAFYQQELEYRRQIGYPPFTRLVRLEFRHYDLKKVEMVAQQMAQQIQSWIEQESRHATRIVGPAPCFFSFINGMHRWQIILVGPNPEDLLRGRVLPDWRIEVNPTSLL